jgi:hypothetical protein
MVYLKCFQAKTLSTLPNPPIDTVKEIMEEVLTIGLHLTISPAYLLYYVGPILGNIYYNELCSGYDSMRASIDLMRSISRIGCEQVPDQLLIFPPRMYLARYYFRQGSEEAARTAVGNGPQDDDLSNDIWAFIKIYKITALSIDKENTAMTYAMMAFGCTAWEKSQKSLEESSEEIPDKVERRWQCESTCGACGLSGERPGGLWVCADCIEINLCNGCQEKLNTGEFVKNVCDASHQRFFFDEWYPERRDKVPVGYVPWRNKDITMEDWKNVLREKYLPRC